MLCGKNDVAHEINLDAFDSAVRNAIFDIEDAHIAKDPRMMGDHVPDSFKK
jgi:hypothetical protein